MSSKAAKAKSAGPRRDLYRGVVIQPPASPPKTSISKLRRAVEEAFAENADALASRK